MSNTAVEGAKPTPDPYDFSLVLGGPLFQLVARARLFGAAGLPRMSLDRSGAG